MNQYNFDKIWVSKIIESKIPFKIKNPVLASIFKFGLGADLLFILFYWKRYEYITTEFLLAYIFAFIWINLGPFLIWYYDEKLLPEFFHKALDLILDQKRVKGLAKKYENLFCQKFWIITIPWTMLLIFVYTTGSNTLSKWGIFGANDFFYWTGFMGVVWIALLTSIGFWGVLTTIFAIRRFSKENLNIDPLHPDKLGGLSCVGYYAIGTTILFASGSLFLPISFQFVSENEVTKLYGYFAIFVYSAFILFSFLYPTIIVHHKAESIRYSILDKLRKKYSELSHTIDINDQNLMHTIVLYLELHRLRDEYLNYKSVKLYPFEPEIFGKLIGSVAIPLIFLVLQIYLPELV